jgi:hypothetical protein
VSRSTGTAVQGQVVLSALDGRDGLRLIWTREDGVFAFDGLEGGSYSLTASTERQETAIQREVAVEAGGAPAEVRLEARPGATLVLRYEGDRAYAHFCARLDGAVLAFDRIERCAASRAVVPAETVRVECSWEGLAAPEVHELTLAAGEERELAFGKGP